MRFLRHLAAVCLVVAAVTGLGLAWGHYAASTLTGGLTVPQGELAGQGETAGSPPPSRVEIQPGPLDLGLSSMLRSENLPYLRHTVIIETGLIAAVVIVDASRRKARRASRAAQLTEPPPSDDSSDKDG